MPRSPRADEAGEIYHALNRGNARNPIFFKDEDYEAFERLIAQGLAKFEVDLIAYQWMNNHWHMVLSPRVDGGMSAFMAGSHLPAPSDTMRTTRQQATAMSIRVATRAFPLKTMITFTLSVDMWNEMHFAPTLPNGPSNIVGVVYGTGLAASLRSNYLRGQCDACRTGLAV